MLNAILGSKIKQTQVFTKGGERIPVTEIATSPCYVVDVKNIEKHGYQSVCLGFGIRSVKNIRKPELGFLNKMGLRENPPLFLREVRHQFQEDSAGGDLQPGSLVKAADIFKEGDKIEVKGISKGKGFQGVVKRHHFKGGPRTHGQSDRERAPGALGQTTTPGRVYKGKRMAGRMGSDRVTVKNLEIMSVDPQSGIVLLKGLVPGGKNSFLTIIKKNKKNK